VGIFRFALGPALDAAAARERDAGVANGRARVARDAAAQALALIDARAADARAALSMPAWLAADWYLERLSDVRARRGHEFAAARENAAHARGRFEVARRARRALDLLRERRLAEHRARTALLEAADLDESNARAREAHRRALASSLCDEALADSLWKELT
jgi:flagellar export protein FliJ